MAILERGQIEELIKHRPKKDKINAAIIQDSRLRFHTVPGVGVNSWGYSFEQGQADFIKWVTSFLKKKDKISLFKNVMRPPHDSNELTKEIFKELRLSLNAQDKTIATEYTDPELELEWELYRKSVQSDERFMEEKVFWAVKSQISSFMIVDSVIENGKVAPYSYLLDASQIVDYQLKADNTTDYLIFNADLDPRVDSEPVPEGSRFIGVIDEASYWLFAELKGELNFVKRVEHNIGWAPAKPIWSDKVDDRNELLFDAPLSTLLGALDWYLFFSVSKRVIDTYGPWPIISMFTSKCTYKDPNNPSIECDSGWLKYKEETKKCPHCSNADNLVGAGSIFSVPAPASNNNYTVYTTDALKFVTMKTDILQYITDQKDRLHDVIYRKTVGKDVEVTREQAINEQQVSSGYESRHAVLSIMAKNMQVIHKFDIDTKNKILFGDRYLGSNVSYGSKFFLKTLSQLNSKYLEAKEAGASSYELKLHRDFIRQTEYRDSKDDLEKMQLLAEIEPFSEYSIAEVVDMQSAGTFVSRRNFVLKLNFNKFVQRFEREVAPLHKFGRLAPKERRLAKIEEKLFEYVDEEIKQLETEISNGAETNKEGGTSQEGSTSQSNTN